MQYEKAVQWAKTTFTKISGVLSVFGSTSSSGEPIIVVAIDKNSMSLVWNAIPFGVEGVPVLIEVRDV